MNSKRHNNRTTDINLEERRIRPSLGSNLPYGFPPSYDCKLKYVETFQFSSLLGVISNQVYSLNSLYDPNVTGVGHQPLFYDQITAVYGRYKVYDVDVRITATNRSDTPFDIVVAYGQGSNTFSSINNAKEQSYSTFYTLGSNTGNRQVATIKRFIHLPSLQGVSDTAWDAEANFGGLDTSAPADRLFLKIVGQPHDTVTADTHVQVELVFHARFKQLSNAIAQS